MKTSAGKNRTVPIHQGFKRVYTKQDEDWLLEEIKKNKIECINGV